MQELTPRQIVAELDKHIIGQDGAKRAVAIAVRNRWRRRRLDADLAREVAPKNIIMVGPTGVGKTEIARRLARLVNAPFIKVEASKYTEVGYHGRDVESMVRDLLDLAINMVRGEQAEEVKAKAEEAVERRLVSILMGRTDDEGSGGGGGGSGGTRAFGARGAGYVPAESSELGGEEASVTRERLREKLREGLFDDREIEITIRERSTIPMIGGMGPDQLDPGMSSMLEQLMPSKSRTKKTTVREARRILIEDETEKLLDRDRMIETAIERTEQSGIIFLDEIDKIASSSADGRASADVSRQGVQRDLLPIVEGSTVTTRHGIVRTDHILFIAAGAFHSASVSDLMPELQGRFPIRVELDGLSKDDFIRILREPDHSLLKQQQALLGAEGLSVEYEDDAIVAMAEIAAKANSTMENIGARRLMTIVERLFEQVSFDAPDMAERGDTTVRVTASLVHQELDAVVTDEDLSRFVL
ncbi:MAG: ATP-dependent protease ATPase subunit HslU [Phycisphaerales bacterium]